MEAINFKRVTDFNSAKSLVIGDYVMLNQYDFKNNSFCSSVTKMSDGHYFSFRKAQIVDILYITEEDLLSDTFEVPNNGGTKCLVDIQNKFCPTPEEISNTYSLVTLVISDANHFIFVDREGYDYNRYLLMGDDFKEMFADVIRIEKLKEIIADAKCELDYRKVEMESKILFQQTINELQPTDYVDFVKKVTNRFLGDGIECTTRPCPDFPDSTLIVETPKKPWVISNDVNTLLLKFIYNDYDENRYINLIDNYFNIYNNDIKFVQI